MNVPSAELDRKLCRILCDHPKKYNNRYTTEAERDLIEKLFWALTNDRDDRFRALFPDGLPETAQLQEVQKLQNGIEYTAAAKGHACGHILEAGRRTTTA
jgi:E3 ubiquitin-protein ligase UBR1